MRKKPKISLLWLLQMIGYLNLARWMMYHLYDDWYPLPFDPKLTIDAKNKA
jgi:hypothetical protein